MNTSNWRPASFGLTVAGAMYRLLPHPPNFAPVSALALFGGARLPRWQAYALPLGLMLVTDPILNWMRGFPLFWWSQIFTYIAVIVSVAIGRQLRSTESAWKIGAGVLVSAVQFFVVTNLGSFFYDPMYPKTMAGLQACFVAAIPFFEKTLASDVLFTAVLFGLHAVLARTVASRERVAFATA